MKYCGPLVRVARARTTRTVRRGRPEEATFERGRGGDGTREQREREWRKRERNERVPNKDKVLLGVGSFLYLLARPVAKTR